MKMKPAPFVPPEGYDRVRVVDSFDALVAAPFGPRVNAACWRRAPEGDFEELAACFADGDEIVSLEEDRLLALRGGLSAGGRLAVDAVLRDQALLRAHGLSPGLECVPRYRRDAPGRAVPTDVYSFHADRATVAADTYLCSYNGAATEGLRNDGARRRIDDPATRAALLAEFRRAGAEDFDAYLAENCYDLHYAALPGAVPFSFGLGNLWRVAVDYPGCPVPPCLHRAPEEPPGRIPRLLLIS